MKGQDICHGVIRAAAAAAVTVGKAAAVAVAVAKAPGDADRAARNRRTSKASCARVRTV